MVPYLSVVVFCLNNLDIDKIEQLKYSKASSGEFFGSWKNNLVWNLSFVVDLQCVNPCTRCLSIVLIFCVEFREFSYLKRDLSQAEKKINVVTSWHLFHSKWSKLSFWVKIVVILSVAQLITTVIFFSAWDTSHVKWGNSRNSIQKMRTLGIC